MTLAPSRKILFVINKKSGTEETDWEKEINTFFAGKGHEITNYVLPEDCDISMVKDEIKKTDPNIVVAVGGDGTVKLVAECILGEERCLAILPAGSANGMAKELNIEEDPEEALEVIASGKIKHIHLTEINDHLCIHLADVGFNAYLIKKFEIQQGRGMWGYFKAAVKALFTHSRMTLDIVVKGKHKKMDAVMVVIANATCYGNGALINPDGSLEDKLFEIIVVKQISLVELFKMVITHAPYNPEKTEVFQTDQLMIQAKRSVHFQVDGEYLGKITSIDAHIVAQALPILVPAESKV